MGTGYLRRLSRTMPSGAVTTTSNCGGTETRSNPCPAGGSAVQAGLPKSTTGPGGRAEEAVYDGWGRVVASRVGTGAWTCTTFDARGRVATVVHPGGRTVTTDYAADPDGTGPAGPDPLTSTVADTGTATSPAGTITTRTDLLGRTVAYTDALGTVTTTQYDALGLPGSVSSTPTGYAARVQTYSYDAAGRVESVAVAGTVVADPTWNTTTGELASVAYPGNAASMTVPDRDHSGRVTRQTWSTPAGVHTETRTVSRAGRVLAGSWSGPSGASSAKTYGYDGAGRLTAATESRATTGAGTVAHMYSYGFGPADPSCTGVAGSVAGAGLNCTRTRTTDTVAGATTAQVFCHDSADRLLKASGGPWGLAGVHLGRRCPLHRRPCGGTPPMPRIWSLLSAPPAPLRGHHRGVGRDAAERNRSRTHRRHQHQDLVHQSRDGAVPVRPNPPVHDGSRGHRSTPRAGAAHSRHPRRVPARLTAVVRRPAPRTPGTPRTRPGTRPRAARGPAAAPAADAAAG